LPQIDLHTHTTHSDGRNTVSELIRQAEANELSAVAITDHFQRVTPTGLMDYVRDVKESARQFSVPALVGIEIHPSEDLAFPSIDKARGVDLILADALGKNVKLLHGMAERESVFEHVSRVHERMCAIPEVDIIAHPLNLGRLEVVSSLRDIDPWLVEHLIDHARKGAKHLEVMSGMTWWFPRSPPNRLTEEYTDFVKKALEKGVKFSIGSDTHCVHGVGNTAWSHRVLERAGATHDDIINVSEILHKERP